MTYEFLFPFLTHHLGHRTLVCHVLPQSVTAHLIETLCSKKGTVGAKEEAGEGDMGGRVWGRWAKVSSAMEPPSFWDISILGPLPTRPHLEEVESIEP